MNKKPQTEAAAREARLAAALRENLKRRKAQARAREDAPGLNQGAEAEAEAPPKAD